MNLRNRFTTILLLLVLIVTMLCPIAVFASTPTVTLSLSSTQNLQQGDVIKLSASASDQSGIKKVEFFDGSTKLGERTSAPYEISYVNIPGGTLSLTAKAKSNADVSATSAPVVVSVAGKPLVWAKKWSYDFNNYTDTTIYTSTSSPKLTLPGTQPATVGLYAGGTITSAGGIYGRDAADRCLEQDSRAGSVEAARVSLSLANLDAPIDNVVAEADVAFSTTTENRGMFSYRTAKGMSSAFLFANTGKITYAHGTSGYLAFKDDNGADMTYEAGKWYRVGIKLDFANKTIMYYLNGKKLNTVDDVPISLADFTYTTELTMTGNHTSTQTGIVYMDNMIVYQEQGSTVTTVLTPPVLSEVLHGTSITFAGYAKDQDNKAISKIEFYASGILMKEVTTSTYSFSVSDLPYGDQNIIARAINADGASGYSKVIPMSIEHITLSKIYCDNMVFQRNKDIKIAGLGINGENIQVSLGNVIETTAVVNGKWDVTIPPQPAIKSITLTVSSDVGFSKSYKNVAIGEVIVCAGQSNMAYSVGYFNSSVGSEADKDYPDIRFFFQPEVTSTTPQTEIPNGYWDIATVTNIMNFSATGFLTGKKYYLDSNGEIPVGLIFAAHGGSSIVPWETPTAFNNDPDLYANKTGIAGYYNTMVAPWTNFTIGSVLWYQGEQNTQLYFPYEKALTAYIEGWRKAWNDDSINFVVIQLPIYNYTSTTATGAVGVRDGQFNVSESLPNVATVVGIDTGMATNIHPTDKLIITERAMLALKHFINPLDNSFIWKSPSYVSYQQQAGKMIISFKDIAGGLKTKDGQAPRGFKVAGDNKVYVNAQAVLVGNTVEIDTSAVVGTPSVRYAWEDCPALGTDNIHTTLNLVNSGSLPLAPFRTDRDRYTFKTKSTDGVLSNPVNFTPVVRSVIPLTQANIVGNKVTITVTAKDYDDSIAKVQVYGDNLLLGEATKTDVPNTYLYDWIGPTAGTHTIYAVATDSVGATSLKQDVTLGTVSVQPVKNTVSFAIGIDPVYTILPFEDLEGTPISSFGASNGVKVKATINNLSASPVTGLLVLAAYNDVNELVNVKMQGTQNDSVAANTSETISAFFTSSDLTAVTKVKAFLIKDITNINPLTEVEELTQYQVSGSYDT